MSDTGDRGTWRVAVGEFCADVGDRLVTQREYETLLQDLLRHPQCPVARLDARIDSPQQSALNLVLGGENARGELPTEKWTLDLAGTTWVVEAWRSRLLGDRETMDKAEIRRVVDCYWKSAQRDDRSQLVSLEYSETREYIAESLKRADDGTESIACLYMDLDHFKEVNDRHGHDVGDRVILQWARMTEVLLGGDCVVLHRSGDEFVLLCPGATWTTAVALAMRLAKGGADLDYGLPDIAVGCSIGIAIRRPGLSIAYEEIAAAAERAVQPPDGAKRRGRISLAVEQGEGAGGAESVVWTLEEDVRRSACVLRSELAPLDVFASPWLNNIAEVARDAAQRDVSLSAVQGAVETALTWLPPPESAGSVAACWVLEDPLRVPPSDMSRIDVALAVARGVFVNAVQGPKAKESWALELRYTTDGKAAEVRVGDGGAVVWTWPATETDGGEWTLESLGECVGLEGEVGEGPQGAKRACLIRIGHKALSALRAPLFAEVITVDDRPTRGGELPDFWEATIARVVALINASGALQFLYILGDARYARETIRRLKEASEWPAQLELMSYKTGRPASEVAAASKRMGGAEVFETEREMLPAIAKDLRTPPTVVRLLERAGRQRTTRVLERRVEYGAFALRGRDGIRVDTIAAAFPVVLEIARQTEAEAIILDAAGQELRELVDFKVVLRRPTNDRVPAFYRDESGSLEEYFRRAFIGEKSLFGAEFAANGQLEAVLTHLKGVVTGGARFATRRAILVVPHRVEAGRELAPLGLVSVRIIPRFQRDAISLLYSFTWRTVEAFVGFPYSLYGSVSFAEYLTEELRSRVPEPMRRQIATGEVSYIAHSLHMFLDSYGQNIARRIVDDASK